MRRPGLPELSKRATRVSRHLPRTRIAIILGVVFFSSFGMFDVILFPGRAVDLLPLRAFSLPLIGLVFYPFIVHRRSRRHGPTLIVIALVAGGLALGIMQTITAGPRSYVYFAGVLVLLFYCYSLLGLPLREALVAGSLIAVIHCAIVLAGDGPILAEKLAQVFITVSVNVMGALTLRSSIAFEYAEMDARHLLAIQHTQLADARDELEHRVLARTRELHASNRALHKALAAAAEQREVVERQSGERLLLIQEVHHRVRNNLQTVLSLFDLESRDAVSPEIVRMENRIRAMAVVHGLMHDEDDPTSVSLRGLAEAIEYQLARREVPVDDVGGEVTVADGRISLDHAVPAAVLLCEVSAVCGGFRVSRGASEPDCDASRSGMTISLRGVGWDATSDSLVCENALRSHLITALVEQVDGTIGCSEDPSEVTIVVAPSRVDVCSAMSKDSSAHARP